MGTQSFPITSVSMRSLIIHDIELPDEVSNAFEQCTVISIIGYPIHMILLLRPVVSLRRRRRRCFFFLLQHSLFHRSIDRSFDLWFLIFLSAHKYSIPRYSLSDLAFPPLGQYLMLSFSCLWSFFCHFVLSGCFQYIFYAFIVLASIVAL